MSHMIVVRLNLSALFLSSFGTFHILYSSRNDVLSKQVGTAALEILSTPIFLACICCLKNFASSTFLTSIWKNHEERIYFWTPVQ